MVQCEDTDVYTLSDHQSPPRDMVKRHYSDSVCLTKASDLKNPSRYYRSTYDFSAPKRYKTTVRLEPVLAPIRYYRSVNYGIPVDMRHKSTVDCDFRPRARGFSETTWIFPKQTREVFKSTYESNQLIDTTWYRSGVSVVNRDTEDTQEREEEGHKQEADCSSNDEGVFGDLDEEFAEVSPPTSGNSSEAGDEVNYIINNNNEKMKYTHERDSMSLSSHSCDETEA